MGKLYKNTIIKNNDAALEEWQRDESEHPYKFAPTKTSGNAVLFPAIEKCNNYIMRHFAASIVEDIKERMYDGDLSVCPGPEAADNRKVWYNRPNTEGGRKRWDARASSAVKRRSRR